MLQRVQTKAPITVLIAARETMRTRLEKAVAAAGLTLTADCATAAEAIAAAAQRQPDLCLVDGDLPGGALAATAAITRPPPAPKVLIIGGHGSDAEHRATLLAGATTYLRGTADDTQLAAAINALAHAGS
jgi:DNA-binding NarL/FixJ family response regulator